MGKIECSVWNNGGEGWGLNILGGPSVRDAHFDRAKSPVFVELNGVAHPFNVSKESFWKDKGACRHIIQKAVRSWVNANDLHKGDRVWLEVVEPYRKFRAVLKEVAA
jgi:hypothetical protein